MNLLGHFLLLLLAQTWVTSLGAQAYRLHSYDRKQHTFIAPDRDVLDLRGEPFGKKYCND